VQAINGLLRGIAFLPEAEPVRVNKTRQKSPMAAAGSSAAGTSTKKASTRPALYRFRLSIPMLYSET
jgi:hypothetical protein